MRIIIACILMTSFCFADPGQRGSRFGDAKFTPRVTELRYACMPCGVRIVCQQRISQSIKRTCTNKTNALSGPKGEDIKSDFQSVFSQNNNGLYRPLSYSSLERSLKGNKFKYISKEDYIKDNGSHVHFLEPPISFRKSNKKLKEPYTDYKDYLDHVTRTPEGSDYGNLNTGQKNILASLNSLENDIELNVYNILKDDYDYQDISAIKTNQKALTYNTQIQYVLYAIEQYS